ncbi:MAG: sugar transferase, partial [Acidimicrobiales bacterium]
RWWPDRLIGPLLVGGDLVAIVVAVIVCRNLGASASDRAAFAGTAGLSLPLWPVVLGRYRLYSARHVATRRQELHALCSAVTASVALTALVGYAVDRDVDRGTLVWLFALALGALGLEREVVRRLFIRARRSGRRCRRVAVAGVGAEGAALVKLLGRQPELGYQVVALVGEGSEVAAELAGVGPVVRIGPGTVEDLRRLGASGVLVATSDLDYRCTNRLVRDRLEAGLHVELSSSLEDIDPARLSVRPLGGFAVQYVEPVRHDGWRAPGKRAFDIAGAVLGLVVTLPLVVLAWVAVRATSRGPVLYRQDRVGRDGVLFPILKLRSMYIDHTDTDTDADHATVVKLRHDPRVTPVGRLLRRTSVDEIPQLVNVLLGHMSLVGPRPEQPCEVAAWQGHAFDRLRVRPGLTGMWQVSGRSEAREAKERWDMYYVDNWSMGRDLAILARTIPAVVRARGAY